MDSAASLLKEILKKGEPTYSGTDDLDNFCFYCSGNVLGGQVMIHERDCLWIRCKLWETAQLKKKD